MYVIEIGSTIVGRCLPTPERLRGGIEQTMPEPLIEGGQAVIRGALGIAGRLVDIPEELRQRMTVASLLTDTELSTDRARQAYLDLVGRGGITVATMRANPQLARTLDGLETASTRFDQRVQNIADEMHDSSEELLGWAHVSLTAAGRWILCPTPNHTRTLLHTISRRPTPGHLNPPPVTSPPDRLVIERA